MFNEGLTLFLPARPRGTKTPRLPPDRALHEHRRSTASILSVVPTLYEGARPRLPLTGRVERAHSDRARSASKKGTWPLFLSLQACYFTFLGMAPVVVQVRTSSEHIPIVRAPGARDHASVIPHLPS